VVSPVQEEGSLATVEVVFINKIIKSLNPKRLFEIGTFNGRLTVNLAANSAADAKVYTLDLPRDKLVSTKLPIVAGDRKFINKKVIGSRYVGTDYGKKIIQLYGDSATFDFSPYYNSIDFVIIDGSHSYKYVLNDSKIAIKLLRNGKGIILWHDYDSPMWPGITIALNELYLNNNKFKSLRYINGSSLVYLTVD
jgi:predicted O-methyltransferase YrrM